MIERRDALRRALSRSDDRIDTARAPHDGPATGADPVETLKIRHARGELTDEEFERRLDRLVALDSIEDAGTGEPSRDAAGIPDR